jgi:hypothetical protein
LGGSEWKGRCGGGGIKMDLTEGSETSEKHNLTPEKYPKEQIYNIQNTAKI